MERTVRVCLACAEKEFGVDVSARKPVIKAIALAYCQEQGEATAAAGAHLALYAANTKLVFFL